MERGFETLFAGLRSLFYGAVGVLLFAWAIVRVRPLDAQLALRLPALGMVPGIVLIVFGSTFAIWSFVAFLTQGRGTPFVADPPRQFVASGPYRYVRNPIYVGQVLILVGIALSLGSLAVLLLVLCPTNN